MTTKIEGISIKIVQAMEKGEDIAELEKDLKVAMIEEQSDKKIRELAEIASSRLQVKEGADKLVARADTQREAIKAFLQARNEVVAPLRKLFEKAKLLPALQDKCYEGFHDGIQAGAVVRNIEKFLPDDFTIPMLQLGDGTNQTYDKAREALFYLQAACGLLSAFNKIEHKPVATKVPDPYAEVAK